MLLAVIKSIVPSLPFDVTIDETNPDEPGITETLTQLRVMAIGAYAAKIIISGMPEDFSYSHPALKTRRKIGIDKMLSVVQSLIDRFNLIDSTGERHAGSHFTEVHALSQDATLYVELLNEASS
jgi:hypothetical protein